MNMGSCELCPKHTYSNNTKHNIWCFNCPEFKGVSRKGATSSANCSEGKEKTNVSEFYLKVNKSEVKFCPCNAKLTSILKGPLICASIDEFGIFGAKLEPWDKMRKWNS